jgi:hypothetical protein
MQNRQQQLLTKIRQLVPQIKYIWKIMAHIEQREGEDLLVTKSIDLQWFLVGLSNIKKECEQIGKELEELQDGENASDDEEYKEDNELHSMLTHSLISINELVAATPGIKEKYKNDQILIAKMTKSRQQAVSGSQRNEAFAPAPSLQQLLENNPGPVFKKHKTNKSALKDPGSDSQNRPQK